MTSLDTTNTEVPSIMIVGDFSSHPQSWGYQHMEGKSEEVENWQDGNRFPLIKNRSDQPTFYSRRWNTTFAQDIALCTVDLHRSTRIEVRKQLGGSDHHLYS